MPLTHGIVLAQR